MVPTLLLSYKYTLLCVRVNAISSIWLGQQCLHFAWLQLQLGILMGTDACKGLRILPFYAIILSLFPYFLHTW